MGSISVDGPGQHNLDRSEDPWGNTGNRMHGGAPAHRVARLRTRYRRGQRGARRAEANRTTRAEFAVDGKAPSEIPAFQPDWRKSAVRNDRGDDGNGGIIRSPIRAIVLPDRTPGVRRKPERWHGSRIILPAQNGCRRSLRDRAKDGCKPTKQSCMPGAGLSESDEGKAPWRSTGPYGYLGNLPIRFLHY